MLNFLEVKSVVAETVRGQWQLAQQGGSVWNTETLRVRLEPSGERTGIFLSATGAVSTISLCWPWKVPAGSRVLNDHWERSYGDLEWAAVNPDRVLPWYFMQAGPEGSVGIGVGTGAGALCWWQVEPHALRLFCDVRAGTDPLELGDRELHVADLLQIHGEEGGSTFQTLRQFCRKMCPQPLQPAAPVYGFNDWYYAYGTSTQATITRDARLLGDLTRGLENRPFCVVDAGYQVGRTGCSGGPFQATNQFFPNMKGLAEDMRAADVRPGLWTRILRTQERVPDEWIRQAPAAREGDLIDPTVPTAVEYLAEQFRPLVSDWGYELVKHDFSTNDIFGYWGFQIGAAQYHPAFGPFRNRNRTTAEVIVDLYRAIRVACGEAVIIGCNTMGHLAAGLVEVQRTGDDTSGQLWARTRKMGVNTLAFRGPQHEAFFAVDADCVGLTEHIPWALNEQWLALLSRSGTPLFASVEPGALGPVQRKALARAFEINSVPQPLGEPLDWMDSVVPTTWRLQGQEVQFNWSEDGLPTRAVVWL